MRFEDKDMQPVVRGLHGRRGVVARQRQKRTGLLNKGAWALYDGKNFDKLVEQITGFVDDLEKLFPVETTRRKLVELEIEEVDDEPSLMALQDAAAGIADRTANRPDSVEAKGNQYSGRGIFN